MSACSEAPVLPQAAGASAYAPHCRPVKEFWCVGGCPQGKTTVKPLTPSIDYDPRVITSVAAFRVILGHVREVITRLNASHSTGDEKILAGLACS
jgi:hypothetical protein